MNKSRHQTTSPRKADAIYENNVSKETKRNLALATAGLVSLNTVFEGLDLEKEKRIADAKAACAARAARRARREQEQHMSAVHA